MNSDPWLRELYETYSRALYRLAAAILQTHLGYTADVQDVLQDVFLIEAMTDDLVSHPNLKVWLYNTTRNLCENYIRGDRRRNIRHHRYTVQTYSSVSEPACAGHAEACATRFSIEQALTEGNGFCRGDTRWRKFPWSSWQRKRGFW